MSNPSPVRRLYAHVPFCPAKCSYCAFVTHVGSLKLVAPYVAALESEAELLRRDWDAGPLDSVYFGGGTPSLLEPHQVEFLLRAFDRLFGLEPSCEVTLEAHPETVDLDKLRGFRQAGVTRLSFGVESLQAGELREVGRGQSADAPLRALSLARTAGFDNVAADLMYGLPRQSAASWTSTLETLIRARPDHLSLYPLSVEPRTVLALRQRRGTLALPADERIAEMYGVACRLLAEAGYEHYEVANWALPGRRCRHNEGYWRNDQFLGLGVGAHAYLKPHRTENVRQTRRYIETVQGGASPVAARERIDARVELAETMMLGLRLLRDGVDLEAIGARFGLSATEAFRPEIRDLTAAGLIELQGQRLVIPEAAVPLANEVWQRFV